MTAAPAEPARIAFAGIGDEAADDLAGQLTAIGALGWRAVELRSVDGTPIAELSDATFAGAAATIADAGLTVPCVASRIGNWARPVTGDFADDVRELDVLARRCATLGTRYIRVMSYTRGSAGEVRWGRLAIARLRELTARAAGAGVTLLHENCTGWAGASADRALRLIDAADSPALRLLFDTGNGVPYGYDAYELLTRLWPYVAHVHIKDATGTPDAPRYMPPGDGDARVTACLRLLLDRGYRGTWSIEPHVALRPHESADAPADRAAGFLAAGRALHHLVRREVLPDSGWSVAADGLRAVPGVRAARA